MAGSDHFVNMHMKHIQWRLDCLVFYFGTSKSIKPERDPDILGMSTLTLIIQEFVLFLPLTLWKLLRIKCTTCQPGLTLRIVKA